MTAIRSLDRWTWLLAGALAALTLVAFALWAFAPAEASPRKGWRCVGPVMAFYGSDGDVTATAVLGSEACKAAIR